MVGARSKNYKLNADEIESFHGARLEDDIPVVPYQFQTSLAQYLVYLQQKLILAIVKILIF